MLSGVEWRNCDICPRRFCVLQDVICHSCLDCQADKKAMGRRNEERQCRHADKRRTPHEVQNGTRTADRKDKTAANLPDAS